MRAGVDLVIHAPDLPAAHSLVDRLGARIADDVRAALTVREGLVIAPLLTPVPRWSGRVWPED